MIIYISSTIGCQKTNSCHFQAIERAHENMKLSTLYYTQGEISNANINRSPTSYLANPEEERNQYTANTDHTMVQLNIFGADDGKPRGKDSFCLAKNYLHFVNNSRRLD